MPHLPRSSLIGGSRRVNKGDVTIVTAEVRTACEQHRRLWCRVKAFPRTFLEALSGVIGVSELNPLRQGYTRDHRSNASSTPES